ncbi:MAG: hypothetical protein HOP28_02000 [Gemmatimonadales bacterium]|nr:hypothetical protein [Gemmatimonadales bacterium]
MLAVVSWVTLGGAIPALAQQIDLDASAGAGKGAWRAAASGQWRLAAGSRLTLSTGLRLTYYAGKPASYRNQGSITATLPDRLEIDPAVFGLNVMIGAKLRLVKFLSAGANIDVAGVAAGPARQESGVALRPARGSLLLYGDNDRGSLNSEFFVAAAVGSRLEFRGGMSHYVVGYRATQGAAATRYLRFDTVPFVGVRWRP